MLNYSVIAASMASFVVVLWMLITFVNSYTKTVNQQEVEIMSLLNQMIITTCIGFINILFLIFLT